jgi:hypothetical protein
MVTGDVHARAALDGALDCVICIDASEAIGRDLAEAIVPPALRDAHRQGLERILRTGEASILGRRLELTAMRADCDRVCR